MWQQLNTVSSSWVTLVLLFVFVVLVQAYRTHSFESKIFIRFFEFTTYLRIFGGDREVSRLRSFQIILLFISVLSYGFLLFFGLYHRGLIVFSWQEYLSLVLLLSGIVAVRYLVLKGLVWLTDLQTMSNYIVFKNIALNGLFSLFALLVITLYSFGPFSTANKLLYGFVILVSFHLFFAIYTYSSIFMLGFKPWIYLILYFCAFKILPWIWVAHRYQLL